MGRNQTFAVGWNIYIYTYQIYAILYVQDCLHAFIPLSIGLMTWETILPLTAAMLAFRPLARSSQRTRGTYNGTVLSRAFRRKVGKSESDSFRPWCSGPRSWLCRTAVRCYDVRTIAPLLWGPLQLSFWRYIRSFPVYLFEYIFFLTGVSVDLNNLLQYCTAPYEYASSLELFGWNVNQAIPLRQHPATAIDSLHFGVPCRCGSVRSPKFLWQRPAFFPRHVSP